MKATLHLSWLTVQYVSLNVTEAHVVIIIRHEKQTDM